MTKVADIRVESQAMAIKATLLGKKCWYVGCGGSVGYSFSLSFGKKLLRCPPPANPSAADKYGRIEPEVSLLVWCSWMLEGPHGPITSSDDETSGLESGLRRLSGRTIQAADIAPNWCFRLEFSGGLVLTIFPDHVGPSASFDGNWELWKQYDAYLVGTDLRCKVIKRDYPPSEASTRARAAWKKVDPTRIAIPAARAYRLREGKTVRLRKCKR
jgi:hypothetical protein